MIALLDYEKSGPLEAESLTRSSIQLDSVAGKLSLAMTDQNMEHPTSGRRRRHKSPPSAQYLSALPVPRLADHLDTELGPSDEEGGKENKRQRSEPATPVSSSSRLPHEYEEVMGITQVDPREGSKRG